MRVNKVTVKSTAPGRWLRKDIDGSNFSMLDDRSYYCIELYKDGKGNNNLQGIAMSDIVHKNGKLWLKPDFKYPDDYCTHVMYIFSGDYIRVKNSKGTLKFEGYYKSVKTINRNQIYLITNNNPNYIVDSITKKDTCIKLIVDLIGRVSGEKDGRGISCGEPLSLLKEKN
jgi:CRISPR-associated endonuclease Csn1